MQEEASHMLKNDQLDCFQLGEDFSNKSLKYFLRRLVNQRNVHVLNFLPGVTGKLLNWSNIDL